MINLLDRIKWALLLLGIMLLVGGGYQAFMAHKTPLDFNDLSEADIKSGIIVEGDIYGNYGSYEYSYKTNYGIKDKSSEIWYYMIPVGEEGFMGIAVNAKENGRTYDKQTDQTYEWLMDEEGTVKEPTPIHVKGAVNKMSAEDQGYFKDALKELGLSSTEIEKYMVPFYISDGAFEGYLSLLIVGAVMTILGIISIIVVKRFNY